MNWGWISLDALLYSVIRFVIIVLFTSSDVAGKGMNANPMAGSEGSTYVMGRTSEEYERLRHQAGLLESITGSVLDRVGLCSGMRCLDGRLRSGRSHALDG